MELLHLGSILLSSAKNINVVKHHKITVLSYSILHVLGYPSPSADSGMLDNMGLPCSIMNIA